MDIPATLSALGSALGIVKELREINDQFDKADLKLKIADLSGALADARHGVIDAEDALRAKDTEIARLSSAFHYRVESTMRYQGLTYEKSPNGERPSGMPFCPVCEQTGLLIRLAKREVSGLPAKCPKCQANFGHVPEFAWS
jgi:hypothetical protein